MLISNTLDLAISICLFAGDAVQFLVFRSHCSDALVGSDVLVGLRVWRERGLISVRYHGVPGSRVTITAALIAKWPATKVESSQEYHAM
jgi:hypothetical protein